MHRGSRQESEEKYTLKEIQCVSKRLKKGSLHLHISNLVTCNRDIGGKGSEVSRCRRYFASFTVKRALILFGTLATPLATSLQIQFARHQHRQQ